MTEELTTQPPFQLLTPEDPRLRQASVEIDPATILSPEVQDLAQNLIKMAEGEGIVGIAAAQVDVDRSAGPAPRIFVANTADLKAKEPPNLRVFINPVITKFSDEKDTDLEGCLSVASEGQDLYGFVGRSTKVAVTYYDVQGNLHEDEEFEGLPAHTVQHEIDHLDGRDFTEAMDKEQPLFTLVTKPEEAAEFGQLRQENRVPDWLTLHPEKVYPRETWEQTRSGAQQDLPA